MGTYSFHQHHYRMNEVNSPCHFRTNRFGDMFYSMFRVRKRITYEGISKVSMGITGLALDIAGDKAG